MAFAPATTFAAKPSDCGDEAELCRDGKIAAEMLGHLSETQQMFVGAAVSEPARAYLVAADELIWQSLREQHAVSIEARSAAAERLIDTYLRVGLSDEALKLYASLDAQAREHVVRGPAVFGVADVGKARDYFFLQQAPALTAAKLASAYAEQGRLNEADAMIGMAREASPVPGNHFGMDEGDAGKAADCVRKLIHATADMDWFDWVFGEDPARHGDTCPRALRSRAYARAAAKGLATSTLPEAWRIGVEPNDTPGSMSSMHDEVAAALKSLPAQRERIGVLKARLAQIDQEDAVAIAIHRRQEQSYRLVGGDVKSTQTASAEDHALAARLAARMAKPVFNPYEIRDVAPGTVAVQPSDKTACGPRIIRCQDVPPLRWELLVSNDYDPTGEVPAAGYWLRRSELAGGASRVFYLGLKEHLPFELVPTSAPFIVGDELRLLVRRAAIDPTKVMFPPIGLRFDQDKKLLQLVGKLGDIMRDSDGDGLTDLAEQQLLLDPNNADSDGDGIPDNEDALPDVAASTTATPRQSAFAAAIAHLTTEPDRAISVGVPGSSSFVRRKDVDEHTLYLIADPLDLAAMSSQRRIVVIPTSFDMTLLKKRPGLALLLPMSVSLRLLDESHAEVSYSSGWAGGTLAMERKNGQWRVGSLVAWVT